MKKLLYIFLCVAILTMQTGIAFAIQEAPKASSKQAKQLIYNKNARTITYAFVFDGPSDKNKKLLKEFKTSITQNLAPYYKASFPDNLVFTGDWSREGAKKASNNALKSNATMIVSLGYLSSKYFHQVKSKNKFVVTIEQYGLRDLGEGFYNPVRQSAKGTLLFQKLVNFQKGAVLMNQSYYNTRKNWDEVAKSILPGLNLTIIPVKDKESAETILSHIPSDCDAVIFTPLYNIPTATKQNLISAINGKNLYTYSTVGKEDVELGVLLGTSALEVDKKVADATSFSIKGILNGDKKFNSKVSFYDDQVLFINKDTAEQIGYHPHLRVLNTAEIISNKKPEIYTLGTIFNKLETGNLDIKRADRLVAAARRASVAAVLRYLPTFSMTLGYQQYNEDYADSAKLLYPEKTGVFKMGFDQVIYSPELVTNILIKHKQLNFKKSEKLLTEQNFGINLAILYVNTLMMENMIKIQKEYVKESRDNLAIARVRQEMGRCGAEEALRWASQLRITEDKLIQMNTELKNLKIEINKILSQNPKTEFELAELKATDPAFYTSEINLIDYLTTDECLEKFTQMIVNEAFRVSPELAKLRAAIKMKKYEMGMYYQKFVLPNAKLSYEYTSLFNRDYTGNVEIPLYTPRTGLIYNSLPHANATNGRFAIYAQWKPVEGGTKIAEIARTKAELDELKLHEQQAKEEIEAHARIIINKAIASYVVIEKKYKAMYASKENYLLVKKEYLENPDISIAQVTDAERVYLDAKIDAMNSQYEFFRELLWVQRSLCSVNWEKASPESKKFIQSIKDNIEKHSDIQLL